MPKKTTGKRVDLLQSTYNNKLLLNLFNPLTNTFKKPLSSRLEELLQSKAANERKMFMDKNIKSDNILLLFNEGTETIFTILHLARDDAIKEKIIKAGQITDNDIYETVLSICYCFSVQQPWYLTYCNKIPTNVAIEKTDKEFFKNIQHYKKKNPAITKQYFSKHKTGEFYHNISTKEHKKITQTFYTPAVPIFKAFDQTSNVDKEAVRQNTNIASNLYNQVFPQLDILIKDTLEIPPNQQIAPLFFENIKYLGFQLLVANEKYNVTISNFTNLGMSEIFKSLNLSKKVIEFLNNNKASLSVIELYKSYMTNPTLFFDLKDSANLESVILSQLKSFINIFHETFLPNRHVQKLNAQELALIKKHDIFLHMPSQDEKIKEMRVQIYSTFTTLSYYLFPINTQNAYTLTIVQCQVILLSAFVIFQSSTNSQTFIQDYIMPKNSQMTSPPPGTSHAFSEDTFINKINKCTNYKKFFQSFLKPFTNNQTIVGNTASLTHVHRLIYFIFLLTILTEEKIDLTKPIDYFFEQIFSNMVNAIPIIYIPLPSVDPTITIIKSKTKYTQSLSFISAKPFIITRPPIQQDQNG